MRKIFSLVLVTAVFSASSAFALSDAEYTEMYCTSPYFKAADDALTQTWKETT